MRTLFVSLEGSCAHARDSRRPRIFFLGFPCPVFPREVLRSPRFLWCLCLRALFFDPGGASAPMTLGCFGVAFCSANCVGLHNVRPFGAQSHGPPAHCLRFAAVVAHVDARLVSGWWSAFAGRHDLFPPGTSGGFLRCHSFIASSPPSTGFAWRTRRRRRRSRQRPRQRLGRQKTGAVGGGLAKNAVPACRRE
jgi:hypothetical protein